jgi:hypothetical protein
LSERGREIIWRDGAGEKQSRTRERERRVRGGHDERMAYMRHEFCLPFRVAIHFKVHTEVIHRGLEFPGQQHVAVLETDDEVSPQVP